MQPQAKRAVRSTVSDAAMGKSPSPQVVIPLYQAQQHTLELDRRERIDTALQADAERSRASAPEPYQFCAEPGEDSDLPLPMMLFAVAVGLVAWGLFGWAAAPLVEALRSAL
jgi:hypothetical protein